MQSTSNSVESAMLRDVSLAVGASDLRRAADIASSAINLGLFHPVFHNARALWAQQQGQHNAAIEEFQRALAFTPSNPVLLNAIAMSLVRLNRPLDGVAFFDRALAIAPDDPDSHYRKGWALASAGEQDAARKSYERAVALRPDYPEALAALAAIAARDGHRDAARDLAARALALNPREPAAVVALGMCDIAERDYGAAEERLKPMLDDPRVSGHSRALMLGFYADALDGQGKYRQAFAAYSTKNEEFRHLHAPRFANRRRTVEFVQGLTDALRLSPAAMWRNAPRDTASAPTQPRAHVFLLGFLRSGTTLLEQVLGVHPDIAALEERETLIDAAQRFLTGADGLERLASASAAELDAARAQYWSRVRSHGVEPAGKVLLDKQPLNTFNLPLIARLFPEARILFALRDPRDVVLSCFRRHFDVNATVFELLRLDDAARFYDSVMTLAEICRERLPLLVHDHRYEDLVEDFETTVRAACEFAGVGWTDAMRDFGLSAQARSIRSPSAAQVRRPLYRDGVAQWRHYQDEMAPALPILRPWVERFGYPAE